MNSQQNYNSSDVDIRQLRDKISEDDIRVILEEFDILDADRNGGFDKNKLVVLLGGLKNQFTKEEIEKIAKMIDKNGDGEVDFNEFITWIKTKSKPS